MPLAGQALPAAGREGLKWGCLALFKATDGQKNAQGRATRGACWF